MPVMIKDHIFHSVFNQLQKFDQSYINKTKILHCPFLLFCLKAKLTNDQPMIKKEMFSYCRRHIPPQNVYFVFSTFGAREPNLS